MLSYKPPDAANDYTETLACKDPHCNKYISNRIEHRLIENPALTLKTCILLFTVRDCSYASQIRKRYFTTSRTKAALTHLDFPVCNHVRTSDSLVYDHFKPWCTIHFTEKSAAFTGIGPGWLRGTSRVCSCRRGDARVPVLSAHYKSCAKCEEQGCDTCFGFRTRERTSNGKRRVRLYLNVYRDLGGLESSSEPGWKLHALDSAGMERMAQQWEAWMEFVKSKGVEWEQTPVPTYLDRLGSKFKKCMASLGERFLSPSGCTGVLSNDVSRGKSKEAGMLHPKCAVNWTLLRRRVFLCSNERHLR
jgi:hypothetical protein